MHSRILWRMMSVAMLVQRLEQTMVLTLDLNWVVMMVVTMVAMSAVKMVELTAVMTVQKLVKQMVASKEKK